MDKSYVYTIHTKIRYRHNKLETNEIGYLQRKRWKGWEIGNEVEGMDV